MSTLERVQSSLAGLAHTVETPRDGTPCIRVAPADLHEICRRLQSGAGFHTNTFVTALDHFPRQPRFELVYQFLSIDHGDRLRVHCVLTGDSPRVPTITDLWPGAAFSERECWDMFGIQFDGHPGGLKRLLMPEDYEHFPLRKDFPHQGIEPDRLYREWDARRHERARLGLPGTTGATP